MPDKKLLDPQSVSQDEAEVYLNLLFRQKIIDRLPAGVGLRDPSKPVDHEIAHRFKQLMHDTTNSEARAIAVELAQRFEQRRPTREDMKP